MKVGIPENNGEVNQHFGQSASFAIIEIDNNNEVVQVDTAATTGLQHKHEGIADFLKEQGVEVVIVGGIGQGAIDGLESRGLKVLFGAKGSIKDVAETFAQGKLVSKRTVCSHHGHGHHHGENHSCQH